MLGSTVCAGGRLALRASGARHLARASLGSRDRLVAFQHLQGSLGSSVQGFSNVRNYWWSKPSPLEPFSRHTSEPATMAKTAIPEETAGTEQIAQIEVNAPTTVATSDVLPPDVSTSALDLSDVASNVIPPLQYGDFAALGLTSWWPSGIMSWSFELLQVSTGMPWFYTIIAGTLFWRALLVPTALTSMRNAARLRPYAAQIKAFDDQAQGVNDRAVQMEIMLKKQKLMEKAGVSLRSMFLPPVVQMVGNLGLFFAIKNMVQLPVVQLTQSGVWFMPDLTLMGDYVMPTLVLLAMNVQFSLMKKDLDPTKPIMAHSINVMRVATFASLPMMSWMSTGLWLSMITGMMLTITQSALLRVPRIRQALAIPPAIPVPPVTMRDTGKTIIEWYRRTRVEATTNQVANQRKPNWTSLSKASRRAK
ncbi:60Kd inner membrane protein-domain-containing protein [Boletus edulis BED1]|uniref:60Kd inner membrane protein-domain-containing protein n=1 Tax=Boletus edulis BED1 TaxID=1328754 RepID=A0AAD4GEY2_BOLED|nr:60Kd inner membrane protein-domain-containing protein [Boletus edulis BED1]